MHNLRRKVLLECVKCYAFFLLEMQLEWILEETRKQCLVQNIPNEENKLQACKDKLSVIPYTNLMEAHNQLCQFLSCEIDFVYEILRSM